MGLGDVHVQPRQHAVTLITTVCKRVPNAQGVVLLKNSMSKQATWDFMGDHFECEALGTSSKRSQWGTHPRRFDPYYETTRGHMGSLQGSRR